MSSNSREYYKSKRPSGDDDEEEQSHQTRESFTSQRDPLEMMGEEEQGQKPKLKLNCYGNSDP